MRWNTNNKGHVFDEEYENFKKREILIYGAGNIGLKFWNSIVWYKDYVKGFVDINPKKYVPDGTVLFSPEQMNPSRHLVIISIADNCIVNEVEQLLTFKGFSKNQTYFYLSDWIEKYQYIYTYAVTDKVIAPFISLQFTTLCNLKCKGCVACNPQVKAPGFLGEKVFEENINALFRHIDFIERLDVCGGEPFLGNYMLDIFPLLQAYRHKINRLTTVTNGTVIPNNKLCSKLHEIDMYIKVDDYSENISKKTYIPEIIQKFKQYSVCYEINKVDKWINLGWEENKMVSEKEAECLYLRCDNYRKSIHQKKLYACDYAGYANEANVIRGDDQDYLDLGMMNRINKNEMLEFLLRYCDKGYCEACKYCNGNVNINTHHIPVAEQ